jgi:putative PEP-CTERM system TPR-repeat lipoprotein
MSNRLRLLLLIASLAGADLAAGEANRLEEAKKYLAKGEAKAAVIELKNLLQQEPGNVEARLMIAEIYLKTGDGPGAAKAYEKAAELNAPKDQWIVSLGRAYLLQNDVKTLLEKINPDADLPAPVRAQVFGLRGMALIAKGDTAKAEESFGEALKLDPNASDALIGLAMMEAQKKNFKKATEYAQQIIAQDPKNWNAWTIIGEAKRMDGDTQGAIEAFSKAVQIQPFDVRARLGRATALLGDGKPEEAGKDIAEVRKNAGDVPLALYLQAVIEFQGKKFDEAEELLNKVSNAMPNHLPSKLLLGTIAYQKGKLETAETLLSQFHALVPEQVPATKLLAATRLKRGKPQEAIDLLKSAEPLAKDDPQFLSLLGSAYLQTKQFDQGTEYLNRAAELAPNAATLKAQLALGRMASGKLDEAVVDLKAAVELDQNLMQADAMLVLALLQQKKYDEAITAANTLKGKMKGDPMPDNLLGAAYMAKGDEAKAREHWNAALKLKPEYSTAAMNLAKLEVGKNNPEAAAKLYQQVLKHDPKNLAALMGLAQLAESRKDLAQMEKYLGEAIDKNPDALQPALLLTRYYLIQGNSLRALEIARGAESRNPNQPLALQNLGLAQLANNQAASALGSFRKLVAKTPDNPEFRHQLAQALYRTGDKKGAQEEWKTVAKQAPNFLPAQAALGELALSEQKFDEALRVAGQLKTQFPKLAAGDKLEGDVQLAQKQYKKALAAYEKAYQTEPSAFLARRIFQAQEGAGNPNAGIATLEDWLKTHPQDADVWLLLGQGYQEVAKPREALGAYEKAYALQPDNIIIQNNLAWIYQETGDPRAVSMAEKLQAAASENRPEIMDTVGWILVQNGKVDKGLPLLQEAAVNRPDLPEIRLHVAEALAKAGRKNEARTELERLLKDKREFSERARAEALLKGL